MEYNVIEYTKKMIGKHTPLYRYDGQLDFSKWQKQCKEKLAELLGIDDFEKCKPDLQIEYVNNEDDYTETRFSFQVEEGLYAPCHLLTPKNVTGKLPVIICLQGHTTGMHISINKPQYDGDFKMLADCPERALAVEVVKRGYAAITLEQRYMGERGHSEDGTPICCSGSAVVSSLMGRTNAGGRVWDVQRLIDVIETDFPQLDKDRIGCMGGSGGGTTTFYAACLEERIKYCNSNVAVCTYRDSIVAMHHCPCNYVPGIAKYFDMGDLGGLVAPRKMVMSSGKEDPIFPIAGAIESAEIIKQLYKTAGAEENFAFYIGDGGHQAYTGAVMDIFEEMLK